MSEPTVFTKIVQGDIPSYKIYEDDRTYAFLDIHPMQPGHTLVVPKAQVDRLEDLSDEDYAAVMQVVRKVMHRVVQVFGPDYRACLKVIGFDVPHAHVHVVPCRSGADFHDFAPPQREPDQAALAEMARTLAF